MEPTTRVYIAVIIATPRFPVRGYFKKPHKVKQTTIHERATATAVLAMLENLVFISN